MDWDGDRLVKKDEYCDDLVCSVGEYLFFSVGGFYEKEDNKWK